MIGWWRYIWQVTNSDEEKKVAQRPDDGKRQLREDQNGGFLKAYVYIWRKWVVVILALLLKLDPRPPIPHKSGYESIIN